MFLPEKLGTVNGVQGLDFMDEIIQPANLFTIVTPKGFDRKYLLFSKWFIFSNYIFCII